MALQALGICGRKKERDARGSHACLRSAPVLACACCIGYSSHLLSTHQPRPQGFSLKKWVGQKPWGRGWAHTKLLEELGVKKMDGSGNGCLGKDRSLYWMAGGTKVFFSVRILIPWRTTSSYSNYVNVSVCSLPPKWKLVPGAPNECFLWISVRRGKYCLEFSITWGRLKIFLSDRYSF